MNTKKLLCLVGLVVALSLSIAGCATSSASNSATPTVAPPTPTALPSPTALAASFPLTVKDDVGRTVTVDKRPERIVSLAPSNTEILFALGLGEKIVGVTQFCDYPAEAKTKPKVGDTTPNLEKIVAAKPDLVVAINSGDPASLKKLEDLKLTVLVLDPKDIAGIQSSFKLLGRVTGTDAAAQKLSDDLGMRIEAVAAKVRGATKKPKVFYELDATDPAKPFTPGPGTFIDALITMAGGQNIAADAKAQWAQLSLEDVIKKDPDLIILGDANYGTTPEQVEARPGWSAISAVKNGAVSGIDDNLVTRPGPRIAAGLEALAKIIQPELFKNP